jgi:hypothetical protein
MLLKNHAGSIPEATWAYHLLVRLFNFLSAFTGCRRVDDSSSNLYVPKLIHVRAVPGIRPEFLATTLNLLHLNENDINHAMRINA